MKKIQFFGILQMKINALSKTILILLLLTFNNIETIRSQNINDTILLKKFEIIETKPQNLKTYNLDSLGSINFNLSSITDKLNLYTPIFIREYSPGGIATATFRGTLANHTLVLFNGFKVNPVMNGQVDFSSIAPFLFDEVEIYSGLQSLRKHIGALGGIISLNTKPYAENKTELALRLDAGSFNNFGIGTKFSQKHKNWLFRTRFFYNEAENNFIFLNNAKLDFPRERRINAAFNKKGLMQEIYYSSSKKLMYLKFSAINNFNELPAPLLQTQIVDNESQTNEIQRLIIGGNFRINNNNLNLNLKVANENWTYQNLQANILSQNKISTIATKSDYSFKLIENVEFKTGIYSSVQKVVSNNYKDNKTQIQNNLYNSLKFNIKEFGIYILNHTVFQNENFNLAPAIFLSRNFNNKFRIDLKNGRNIRYPSLNDLYWFPGGNPNLKHEESISHELLLTFYPKKNWQTQLNFTRSNIKNLILWAPTSDIAIWQAENIGRVNSNSIDFYNKLEINILGLQFASSQSYSYCRSIDKSNINTTTYNKQLIYVPNHNASISAELKHKSKYIILESHYAGKRFTRSDNKSYMPSHFNHNLKLGYKLKKHKLQYDFLLRINNITSENYQIIAWQPMPKRSFMFSINVSYIRN